MGIDSKVSFWQTDGVILMGTCVEPKNGEKVLRPALTSNHSQGDYICYPDGVVAWRLNGADVTGDRLLGSQGEAIFTPGKGLILSFRRTLQVLKTPSCAELFPKEKSYSLVFNRNPNSML